MGQNEPNNSPKWSWSLFAKKTFLLSLFAVFLDVFTHSQLIFQVPSTSEALPGSRNGSPPLAQISTSCSFEAKKKTCLLYRKKQKKTTKKAPPVRFAKKKTPLGSALPNRPKTSFCPSFEVLKVFDAVVFLANSERAQSPNRFWSFCSQKMGGFHKKEPQAKPFAVRNARLRHFGLL